MNLNLEYDNNDEHFVEKDETTNDCKNEIFVSSVDETSYLDTDFIIKEEFMEKDVLNNNEEQPCKHFICNE